MTLKAIVGVGASAGGLEGLRAFFSTIQPGLGLSYVVIQHLSADHDSRLVEILAKHTRLTVKPVESGSQAETDTIHVIQPGTVVRLSKRAFDVSEAPEPRYKNLPVDAFLRSLARNQGNRSVAVILSGNGADGSQGLRDVKEQGGIVLVQDPEEAEHDPMPRNAIQTRQADFVAPAAKLAEYLASYVSNHRLFGEAGAMLDDDQALEQILETINTRTGQDFSAYKRSTFMRRVQRRMGLAQVHKVADYILRLQEDPEEVGILVHDLLICVTSFFRNPAAWATLRTKVLEPLLSEGGRDLDDPVRIWIPGCATGEEAYTMAILVAEIVGNTRSIPVKIFATDVSETALETARAGRYPEAIESDLTKERLEQYFVGYGSDGYQVSKLIREMVVFALQDLRTDPPFSSVDLISCRNLLIYLEQEAQEEILDKFHFALRPKGHLFLGSAESTGKAESFETLDKEAHIFRRMNGRSRHDLSMTMLPPARRSPSAGQRDEPDYQSIACEMLLTGSDTAVALLNEHFQPLYLGGNISKYLVLPEGRQRYSLLDMARRGLALKLRSALHTAKGADEPVEFRRARIAQDDESELVVRGRVMRTERDGNTLLFVYLEEDVRSPSLPPSSSSIEVDAKGEEVVPELEAELHETRSELNATIEELENAYEVLRTTHEEAMSANEELQAGSEELEASKEELQSLNEELTTLNAQLEEKIGELESANNDLDNLIASTKMPVVFLDRSLRTRTFTPEAVDRFHLSSTDIGKPVDEIEKKFEDDSLAEDASKVLKDLREIHREVETREGRCYLRRIHPYRTHDDRIAGIVATFHDVTELKEAEQKVRDQESQLRLITNSLPVLIAYVDDQEIYRFANATYETWFGVDAKQVVGRTVRDVLGEEAYDQIRKNIHRALSGEEVSWTGTLPYSRGRTRHVQVDYIPHFDGSRERPIGYYALIQDISARREAEERLARSEREYRTIFELAGSGKAQADVKTGQFLRVNRRFCEITGYSSDELLEMSFSDLTHPDDREEDLARIEAVHSGDERRWQSEKRYIRKDGEIVWVLVSGTLMLSGEDQPMYTVATIQDITILKKAEAALRESEERFRTLADNISQLAWIADASGWIFWYNKRWFDYTGTTLEHMEGWGWQEVHHPDHVERVVEKFREHVEKGIEWEDIFPLRSRDGEFGWFLSRAMPIRDDDGKIIRWFGTNTDITEQMVMEQKLKEADRRKDEFLATLAHELRNPLAPIRTSVELLSDPKETDAETVRHVLAIMERQTSQLIRLVDDLLDLSRITRGKIALQRDVIDLESVLSSSMETVRPMFDQSGQQIDLDLPDQDIPIDGDEMRLSQVFSNLLSNAIKFTPEGSRINVKARVDGDRVKVAVEDRGIGIPEEMRERIFEIFAQMEPLDRRHSGLGIGLTLVRSLVELHDGTVEVQSEEGKGSTFTVSLPLADQPAATEQAPKPGRSDDERGVLRILVVDDNEDAATLIAKLLSRDGHEVEVAFSGEDALEKGKERNPDLILLDLGMPGMNGYETFDAIRKKDWGRDIPIAALTGWGQEEERRKTSEAGFDGHLVKPLSSQGLREALNTLTGES